MRLRRKSDGDATARGAELEKLKRTTSSGFYCGICGTRQRGKHLKERHLVTARPCANSYRFPPTCRAIIPGRTPSGAQCTRCDPQGNTRVWRQPKDEPLP